MKATMQRAARMVLFLLSALAVPGRATAQAADPATSAAGSAPVALVVANSAYTALPKLPTCELSANLVASVLSRAGFRVIRQTNPSNARLGTAIASVGDEVGTAAGRSMIYLCGYVASYSERLFVVPVEARLEREADVLSQGIVARLLMASVTGPDSKAGLVLMDVATPPGQPPPAVESMLRPTDAMHGGLAIAVLPAGAQGPAPLAAALADLVAGGRLELGSAMAELRSAPGLGRSLLAARPPTQSSWLLGSPPATAAPAPPPLPTPVTAPPQPPSPQPQPQQPQPPPPQPQQPQPPPAPLPEAPAARTPPDPAAQGTALAEPSGLDRRRIQLGLQRLGYFRGRIDGLFGADTTAAIKRYQKDGNADPTGRLTTKQADQLLQ